jgi:hypothetical protein
MFYVSFSSMIKTRKHDCLKCFVCDALQIPLSVMISGWLGLLTGSSKRIKFRILQKVLKKHTNSLIHATSENLQKLAEKYANSVAGAWQVPSFAISVACGKYVLSCIFKTTFSLLLLTLDLFLMEQHQSICFYSQTPLTIKEFPPCLNKKHGTLNINNFCT